MSLRTGRDSTPVCSEAGAGSLQLTTGRLESCLPKYSARRVTCLSRRRNSGASQDCWRCLLLSYVGRIESVVQTNFRCKDSIRYSALGLRTAPARKSWSAVRKAQPGIVQARFCVAKQNLLDKRETSDAASSPRTCLPSWPMLSALETFRSAACARDLVPRSMPQHNIRRIHETAPK